MTKKLNYSLQIFCGVMLIIIYNLMFIIPKGTIEHYLNLFFYIFLIIAFSYFTICNDILEKRK